MLPQVPVINEFILKYNIKVECPHNVFIQPNMNEPFYNVTSPILKTQSSELYQNIQDLIQYHYYNYSTYIPKAAFQQLTSVLLMAILKNHIDCPLSQTEYVYIQHTKDKLIWNNCIKLYPQIEYYRHVVLGRSSWIMKPEEKEDEKYWVNVDLSIMQSIEKFHAIYKLGLIPYGDYILSVSDYQKVLTLEMLLGSNTLSDECVLIID